MATKLTNPSQIKQHYKSLLKKSYPLIFAGEHKTTTAKLDVMDKHDYEKVSEVSVASQDLFNEAITKAHSSRRDLVKMPNWERKKILLHVAQRLAEKKDEISGAIAFESGKILAHAEIEVSRAIDTFTIAAEESIRRGGEFNYLDVSPSHKDISSLSARFPIGLLGFITPFNFPLNLVAHKIAPAIAVGCPFVLKPAPTTPISSLYIGDFLMETSLPKASYSILPTLTVEDALPMQTRDEVRLISFTGSDKVGWQIYQNNKNKKVVLELGGNAPCIIDGTVGDKLPYIAERIKAGGYGNNGESCISVQNIYVHESLYEKFKPILTNVVKSIKYGPQFDPSVMVGPLINPNEPKKLKRWVEEAVSKGANVLVGGNDNGNFFEPTLMENVDRSCQLHCSEAFGPICNLNVYSDFKTLVDTINEGQFGLQVGVFTNNLHTAWYSYQHLEFGGVVINDIPSMRVDAQSYGGWKKSGVGKEGLLQSMEEFTEEKLMLMKDFGTL